MIARRVYLIAFTLAVAGLELTAAFGASWQQPIALAVGAVLGVIVYHQGEKGLVEGSVFGNIMIGFAAGTALGLGIGTGLLVWLLSIPADYALWRTGLLMWGAWSGVGFSLLASFFIVGLVAAIR